MIKAGYKKLTLEEAKKFNKAGTLPDKLDKKGTPIKRFALAISTEMGSQLDEILKIYNHPENKNGELIHVLLASQGYNEGIDLKAVRHIHFFEPLVTMASDKQTLGRAARYCSHADLDKDAGQWRVKIHRYMSETPVFAGVTSDDIDKRIQEVTEQHKQATEEHKQASEQLKADKKNAELKGTVAELKGKVAELKKQIADLTKEKKKAKSLDVKSAPNIEELIFKESRERMKDIFTIYQCMKEAAVDCKVLQKFHSATGTTVQCEAYSP
jgi:type I site-specific restriction endonuclease